MLLDPRQFDFTLTDADMGWKGKMEVYYGDCDKPEAVITRVHCRKAKRIPFLEPVVE